VVEAAEADMATVAVAVVVVEEVGVVVVVGVVDIVVVVAVGGEDMVETVTVGKSGDFYSDLDEPSSLDIFDVDLVYLGCCYIDLLIFRLSK